MYIRIALRVITLAAAALIAAPAYADDPPARSLSETLEEMRDGAESLLRDLFDDIEPQLREMEPHLEQFGARLRALADQLGGMAAYHPPEILPNGDIILRRRVPLEGEDTVPPDLDDDAPGPDAPETPEAEDVIDAPEDAPMEL